MPPSAIRRYFLQSSFTPDGRTLIFTSYRTGSAQLFEICPYPDGEIRQLTGGPAIHPFSPAIHPDGGRIFFVRGGGIWEIDRGTLEEHCIVDFPARNSASARSAPVANGSRRLSSRDRSRD